MARVSLIDLENAEGDNVVNITLQDVCPDNTANHNAIGTFDPVGYAIVLDALGTLQ